MPSVAQATLTLHSEIILSGAFVTGGAGGGEFGELGPRSTACKARLDRHQTNRIRKSIYILDLPPSNLRRTHSNLWTLRNKGQ